MSAPARSLSAAEIKPNGFCAARNPNVFYQTGIAHTLGREVIQIAQSVEDVPFDLRGIRSQTYLNNGEGLERLKAQVVERLNYLTAAGHSNRAV